MFQFLAAVIAFSTPTLAASPDSPRELAQDLRKDWDILGLEVDATSSHTLASVGPRYQLVTKPGLYIDAAAGVGATLRDGGAPIFGDGHAYVGWSLLHSMKNRDAIFNRYQTASEDATTYSYLETEVIAQRNIIVYGGARTIVGRGPDLADGTVAPAYASLAGGVAFLTTWRQVKEHGGEQRMIRGVQGLELTFLYAPQESESEGFSNFRHFGGELRYTRTTELGRMAAPFHLGLGMEPGLGPMLRLGMMFPVMSPLSGHSTAKVGEVRH